MFAVELERGFRLIQRCVSCGQFVLQNGLLALEDGGADGLLAKAHIHQAILLGFQCTDQSGLGLFDLDNRLLADVDQCLNGCGATLHLLGRELDGPLHVVALDGSLDQFGVDAGPHRTARALDSTDTEVVGVALAGAASTQAVDQSPSALAAVDAPSQVVMMLLWPLTGNSLFIELGLHSVERLLVDQWLMPTWKGLLVGRIALVDDDAQVVAVTQDALEG